MRNYKLYAGYENTILATASIQAKNLTEANEIGLRWFYTLVRFGEGSKRCKWFSVRCDLRKVGG